MKKSVEADRVVQSGDYTIDKRPTIDPEAKVKLWVRSGGRCAICNKYLLDLNYNVNLAEMAHIVGWSKAKGSPRGNAPLELDLRNNVDNLMLLCADHHKIVDTASLLQEFTVERLIDHKEAHEQRIFQLTDITADDETVVLRMVGGIRGGASELSKETVRKTIFQSDGKYANFLNSFDRTGIDIDLNQLPEPELTWDSYWEIGTKQIDDNMIPLQQGIKNGHVRHLSVFAFSRIPLMIYLGHKLDDKTPVTLYQKHREGAESWLWSTSHRPESFEFEKLATGHEADVTLVVSLSGKVDLLNLPTETVSGKTIYEIRPVGTIPNRDILQNRESLENFKRTYHDLLSHLEATHQGCNCIYLIPSVPVSAVVSIGRGLMRHAHPEMLIYDRSKKTYRPTIKINSHETN